RALDEEGKDPGWAVAARVELVEVPERPEPCFLDQVLGLGPVVREPERRPVQEIQVHERDAFELADLATIPDPPEHRPPEVPLYMLNPVGSDLFPNLGGRGLDLSLPLAEPPRLRGWCVSFVKSSGRLKARPAAPEGVHRREGADLATRERTRDSATE